MQLLDSLLAGRVIRLVCGDFDKYNRILGTVFVIGSDNREINVNQTLIDSKLVFPYKGDTKMSLAQ